jgi:lipoate-protein ligase A
MTRRRIQLARNPFPGRPAYDTAVSNALLRRAAEGSEGETLRLYRPDAIVAFGKKDVRSPSGPEAVRSARNEGFEAIQRLAGGRAAVFHESTLAFAWAIPDREPRARITERFKELADLMVNVFRALGVDARIGAVPGEYCPGPHSVNARGKRKLMGVGQRVISRAAHVGGVVVVARSQCIQRVLTPVYAALGLAWQPETAGSLQDEVGAVTLSEVEEAILEAFATRYELTDGELSASTLTLAEKLKVEHQLPDEPTQVGRRLRGATVSLHKNT